MAEFSYPTHIHIFNQTLGILNPISNPNEPLEIIDVIYLEPIPKAKSKPVWSSSESEF